MGYQYNSLLGALTQEEIARRADLNFNQILIGKMNINQQLAASNKSIVTFASGTTSTVITFDPNILGELSTLLLQPTNSEASATTTAWYESARSVANNTMTLTHDNNGSDRTFRYALLG